MLPLETSTALLLSPARSRLHTLAHLSTLARLAHLRMLTRLRTRARIRIDMRFDCTAGMHTRASLGKSCFHWFCRASWGGGRGGGGSQVASSVNELCQYGFPRSSAYLLHLIGCGCCKGGGGGGGMVDLNGAARIGAEIGEFRFWNLERYQHRHALRIPPRSPAPFQEI